MKPEHLMFIAVPMLIYFCAMVIINLVMYGKLFPKERFPNDEA